MAVIACTSDLRTVRDFAADLSGWLAPLDVVVHNAGVLPATRRETGDGHELTLATHVLGPVLLTECLIPTVANSAGPRVILMSSGEGPLDQAMLDEFAGPALDAAGVTIIPIHGTWNLEGLIDGEFTTRLGIKTGVLTDHTVTATVWERSSKKRSAKKSSL